MVVKWKCLKSRDKILVRIFNLRSVSQAYQMNSFKELEYFMKSLLSVASRKSIGCTSDGKAVASDIRMNFLNSIIKGNVNINDKIETIMNDDDDDDESLEVESFAYDSHEANSKVTNRVEWANSVLASAKKNAEESEHGIINACYNTEFAKQIKTRLLPYFPYGRV